MRVAAPEGVWTRFFSVQRTIDVIHTATPRQWILIMVASPADALALVKGGVPITKISIGHMQAGEGKRPATPAVAVDDTDVAALRELQKLGIELEIRYLPSSAPDPIGNPVQLIPWGRRKTDHFAFVGGSVWRCPPKLCRFTTMNCLSPSMPNLQRIKPQVDELLIFYKPARGRTSWVHRSNSA